MFSKSIGATFLLGLILHASAFNAQAQEPERQSTANLEATPDVALDVPRFAGRASFETFERRGRWMTSWGAASLGVGGALVVGTAATFATCKNNPGCDHIAGFGAMVAGGILLTAGAILVPIGVSRKRWGRKGKERDLNLSVNPTGVQLSGTF